MPKSNQMYQVSYQIPLYQVFYQIPYGNQEWRNQYFNTLDEAERMVEFYISCGSPAKLIELKVSN